MLRKFASCIHVSDYDNTLLGKLLLTAQKFGLSPANGRSPMGTDRWYRVTAGARACYLVVYTLPPVQRARCTSDKAIPLTPLPRASAIGHGTSGVRACASIRRLGTPAICFQCFPSFQRICTLYLYRSSRDHIYTYSIQMQCRNTYIRTLNEVSIYK
jgi:hypothetical protein